MEINEFAKMSKDRAVKNDPDGRFDWQYYVVALAGEAGEISNHLKKILRGDHDLNKAELAEEVADAITYGFLLLSTLGVDPEKTLLDKYEKVNQRIAAGGFGARPEAVKYSIVVNGEDKVITKQRATYDDIVDLVMGGSSDAALTITYRYPGENRDGILGKSARIRVKQGTIFNAYNTGNA